MRLTGHSATGLARAAGLTPSTINRFMHRRVRHTLSQRTMLALMTETFLAIKDKPRQALDSGALAELAPAIAIYEQGILEQAPDVQSALTAAKSTDDGQSYPGGRSVSDLPVLMTSTRAVTVQDGDFAKAPLNTQRPPFLEGDPRAFALLVDDDGMMPRFDSGDMLYVSPIRHLEGSTVDVVLEYRAGGFSVGQLQATTPTHIRVATLNPRTRTAIERAKLRGIYRIVGVQRLGG